MSATVELAPGTRLAGYRVVSARGRGGMGVVHLAHDTRRNRRDALKLSAPEPGHAWQLCVTTST